MKATLIYRYGPKGVLPDQEVVYGRSIYVRDGALVVQSTDGEGNSYERGIPLYRLTEYTITKRLKAAEVTEPQITETRARSARVAATGASGPFDVMRGVVDGWISGAKENHVAMGHRGENTGSECWTSWHSEDIGRMIEDAEREHGAKCPTCGSADRAKREMTGCGFVCDDPSGWHANRHSLHPTP